MPEQILTVLKVCLLLLIYLFFLRVLRAVWVEVSVQGVTEGGASRRSKADDRPGRAVVPAPTPGGATATATANAPRPAPPAQRVAVIAPAEMMGAPMDVGDVVTVGRDPTSTVTVSDGYLSHHHARFYSSGGGVTVEDMGSTNGTFVNERRIAAPTALNAGDRVRCGSLTLEAL